MKLITPLVLLLVAVAASAATVTSAPLVKAPFNTHKSLFVTSEGGFTCPEGYDMYVRAVRPPSPTDPKNEPKGDYESFFFAKSANPEQPVLIVDRPGVQEFIPVCLQVSK